MGLDLMIDVAMFYVIYKFLWLPSRTKHVAGQGYSMKNSTAAYIVFCIGFVLSLVIPYLVFTGMARITMMPFIGLGSIAVLFFLSVRIPLDGLTDKPEETSPVVPDSRWIGGVANKVKDKRSMFGR